MPTITNGKYIRYNNKRFFVMTDSIAVDGSTAVPEEATEGSIGVTTHATGKSYWFVSDGDNWIANGGAVAFTSFADIMGDPVDNTNITDYINELIPNGVRIATTTVQTNVGTKQALLAAVPVGKKRNVVMAVPRNPSSTLAALGGEGDITLGFNSSADNWFLDSDGTGFAALNGTGLGIQLIPPGKAASYHIGTEGEVFGIVFGFTDITATLDIDVHYYDVDV